MNDSESSSPILWIFVVGMLCGLVAVGVAAFWFVMPAMPLAPGPVAIELDEPAPEPATTIKERRVLEGGQAVDEVPGKPPQLLVPPYLQLPTPNEITILWETDRKLAGEVNYGLFPKLIHTVQGKPNQTLHEVRLKGLSPGATYYYRIRSGPIVSPTYSFKMAPEPGTPRWRMGLYGDSRSRPEIHKLVVDQVAKANVNLILHTGDIVANGKDHDSWRTQFFAPLAAIAPCVPWVSTIGNHERDSDNYFSYMALPGNERYFSFDFGNAHIICLDSNGWIEKGRDSKQYQWLEEDLKKPRSTTWTFIAFHHPLFSAHRNRGINNLRWDWAPLLLDPANKVDGVFTGHDHFYARNFRMGRASAKPQQGVLFLTSAGGAASLYPTKQRDYVAKEKSVHHFTLFEFDGDKVTLTATDITGAVVDRYVLTKEPTPADEFCAYEIEELREFLRKALNVSAVVPGEPSPVVIDATLRVPTRFRIPVSGKAQWEQAAGWKVNDAAFNFRLQPGQPLEIPLRAEAAMGPYPHVPKLTITFDPGHFRNRVIELFPFKLSGAELVRVRRADKPPVIDGQLEKHEWPESEGMMLIGYAPHGGRGDRVHFRVDANSLYVAARLDDPASKVKVTNPDGKSPTGNVLPGEHVRVRIVEGEQSWMFGISPENIRHFRKGDKDDEQTPWQAAARSDKNAWSVEMAIPRSLLPDLSKAKINFIHQRGTSREATNFELCPAYELGTNPDLIPDWKVAEKKGREAQMVLD